MDMFIIIMENLNFTILIKMLNITLLKEHDKLRNIKNLSAMKPEEKFKM